MTEPCPRSPSWEPRDEALAAGADAFLQKPFDPLELVSTVKDLLGSALVAPPRGEVAVDERLRCGDEGLDLVLGGGLPMNGINLIIGAPGSGKTILALRLFVFAGATEERPAITVSIAWREIRRYVQMLPGPRSRCDRPFRLLRGPRRRRRR